MPTDDHELQRQWENAAQVGEVARTLVHEFNNYLNTLLLQAAIAETTAPQAPRFDIAFLRQESQKIVKLIRDWQRITKTSQDGSQAVDLNHLLRELDLHCGAEPGGRQIITLELLEGPLRVQGSRLKLRQVCTMLVQAVLTMSDKNAAERMLSIRTDRKSNEAILTIANNGPSLPDQALAELFNPSQSAGPGLLLGACESLAKRLRGRLYAVNIPGGGLAISFVAPAFDT